MVSTLFDLSARLVPLLLLLGCGSQPDAKADPLVGELASVYEAWRTASLAGDLEGFFAARDPEEVERLVERFGRPLDGDDISARSTFIPALADLRFIDVLQEGDWARLRYHGGDAEPDAAGPRVRFHILLFHLHDDGWRLATPGSLTHAKFTDAGAVVTIDDIAIPDRLRLPSQRE